jgi:hypothetical protein
MAPISVPLVNRLDDRVRESLSSHGEVCERVSELPDLSRGDSSFRVLDRRQEPATSLLGDSFAAPMVWVASRQACDGLRGTPQGLLAERVRAVDPPESPKARRA